MAIEIKIVAENATEMKAQLLSFVSVMDAQIAVSVPAVEEKQARTRSTKKTEPEKPSDEEVTRRLGAIVENELENAKQAQEVTQEVSDEELRAAANEKIQAGKRAGVAALVKEFGAPSVTGVPAARRADFLAKLEAL